MTYTEIGFYLKLQFKKIVLTQMLVSVLIHNFFAKTKDPSTFIPITKLAESQTCI